jgi:hypothetical protein
MDKHFKTMQDLPGVTRGLGERSRHSHLNRSTFLGTSPTTPHPDARAPRYSWIRRRAPGGRKRSVTAKMSTYHRRNIIGVIVVYAVAQTDSTVRAKYSPCEMQLTSGG